MTVCNSWTSRDCRVIVSIIVHNQYIYTCTHQTYAPAAMAHVARLFLIARNYKHLHGMAEKSARI